MYKLIIFDADGTLTPQRPTSTADFEEQLLPGVALKVRELKEAGVTLVIASNQSAKRDRSAIGRQLDWTCSRLNLDGFIYETRPGFKKPSPHMVNRIVNEVGVTRESVLFVGDQETDQQAAHAAGVDFAWAAAFFGGAS